MIEHPRTPHALVTKLRRRLPTLFPVRIFWSPKRLDSNALATTEFVTPDGGTPFFLITLSIRRLTGLPPWLVQDVVVHEYAHAIVWTAEHTNLKDHGSLWGAAYSMAYQIQIGEIK